MGYCFGAKYVLLLGSELPADVAAGQRDPATQAEEGMVRQGPQIKCGAIAHATGVGKGDMEGCGVPISVVAVEADPMFPDHVREAGLEGLKGKGVECECRVYEGVPHGFAVVGEYGEEGVKGKQGEAYQQMLGWLKGH